MNRDFGANGELIRPLANRLWTPDQGLSGLIVVARPRPLAVVVGGHVHELSSGAGNNRGGEQGEGRQTVSLGGLVVISTSKQGDPTRVVGHPDLASGTSVRHRDTLYVSVSEAVYRERMGEDVEIHLQPTAEDGEALASVKQRARRRWDGDQLPDGWTRPLPPPGADKTAPAASRRTDTPELSEELRALAERFRSKGDGDASH